MHESDWKVATDAWNIFAARHPELGFKSGGWSYHNFLRSHRAALVARGAIRKARNRFWVAHVERFCAAAFDCATGHCEVEASPAPTGEPLQRMTETYQRMTETAEQST